MSKNAELMSTAPSSCFVRDTCVLLEYGRSTVDLSKMQNKKDKIQFLGQFVLRSWTVFSEHTFLVWYRFWLVSAPFAPFTLQMRLSGRCFFSTMLFTIPPPN